MTPAEELRAAATRSRCDHSFPVQPPEGSLARPGNCRTCGQSWDLREIVSDELAEPLATLLEKAAARYEFVLSTSPAEQHSRIEPHARATVEHDLAIARVINGGA